MVEGVLTVEPGYAGGSADTANYQTVCGGRSGHAEVVRVSFDPQRVDLSRLLDIFWQIHDPTTADRQGSDVGHQYRSVIFYEGDEQKAVAERSLAAVQKTLDRPIVTQLIPLPAFYPAEAYHHNYFRNHPEQAYCQAVIRPKLSKLQNRLT